MPKQWSEENGGPFYERKRESPNVSTELTIDPTTVGPAVQRLSAKRQRFVLALCNDVEPGPGAEIAAAAIAGYKGDGIKAQAARLLHDPAVIEAVIETARQAINLAAPLAVATLKAEMQSGKSADRIKAAAMVLDRFMPAKVAVDVKIETIDHTADAIAHLRHLLALGVSRAALETEFGPQGLAHYEALLLDADRKIIDVSPNCTR
jgi:hypothetical protein